MTAPPPLTAAECLALLEAVREAIDIPHAATVGGGEKRAAILEMRVINAVVMLQSVLDGESGDAMWSARYCRERLAEHPATGYRTWDDVKRDRQAAMAAAAPCDCASCAACDQAARAEPERSEVPVIVPCPDAVHHGPCSRLAGHPMPHRTLAGHEWDDSPPVAVAPAAGPPQGYLALAAPTLGASLAVPGKAAIPAGSLCARPSCGHSEHDHVFGLQPSMVTRECGDAGCGCAAFEAPDAMPESPVGFTCRCGHHAAEHSNIESGECLAGECGCERLTPAEASGSQERDGSRVTR